MNSTPAGVLNRRCEHVTDDRKRESLKADCEELFRKVLLL